MNQIITFIAAISAAISVGILSYLLLRQLFDTTELDTMNLNLPPEEKKRLPLLFRLLLLLLPYTRRLARHDFCASLRQTDEVKLTMAGYSEVFSPTDFTALRIAFVLASLLLLALGILSGRWFSGLALAAVLAIYPGVWLTSQINRRHLSILKALPNMLDLLTLSVEAGKDFVSSLRDFLARRRLDPLGEEFMRTFQEIQLGKKRTEALREMAQRVRQPELTSTLNAVIQAEEMGVSIANLLRIQGDALRNKRFTRAEKLANEAPVKIILPIILFIFPSVLIILGLPMFMQIARFF